MSGVKSFKTPKHKILVIFDITPDRSCCKFMIKMYVMIQCDNVE